jgi:NAD(P)-dependent dehydrogenase (short-subunit alcohol dehydrogenase family)
MMTNLSTIRVRCLLATALVAWAVVSPCFAQPSAIDPDQPTVLITGSNRGIGLAFARHYAREGWNVIATTRTPERASELKALARSNPRVVIEQLDVTDYDRITELAAAYSGTPIDLLINNAGVYGEQDKQAWGSLDPATFHEIHAVNVLGPLKMTEAFADHVAASRQKKIVSITSGAGSVSPDRVAGGGVFYGISKAALNMAMRKARTELVDRGIIVALIAPGMVSTDMLVTNRPSLVPRARPAEESVADIVEVIENLDQSYDGRPRNYDGRVLPW